MVDLKRNLEFAIESAKLAGNFLSENYSKDLDVVMDEGRDIKLKVDQEAEKIITTSTAEAAKLAQNDRNIYCIANLYAADLFGLVNHTSDIQDTKNNRTRFLVISKSLEKKGKNNKTSIMINLKDQPGSLMKILKPFSDLKINMTRIETRPSRNNIYLHTFFIDFEGFYEDEKITKLIEILEDLSEELRIIGSYESLN